MRVVEQTAEIFHQPSSDKSAVDKHIERCARICYKSEHLIKEGSATNFVQRMIDSQHYAMLEHASIYLKVIIGSPVIDADEPKIFLKDFFMKNHYSRVKKVKYKKIEECIWRDEDAKEYIAHYKCPCNVYYITTNYRVLIENDLIEKTQDFLCTCTENHIRRITAHFVTDRGVWNECIRHRSLERLDDTLSDIIVDTILEKECSFAQESSRFCNYSKDKFNHELSFIYPDWANNDLVDNIVSNNNTFMGKIQNWVKNRTKSEYIWVNKMAESEKGYFSLIENGCRAEEARTVLNNSLKTELVMTGFDDETGWKHFFDLRKIGTTGKPQSEMKSLATMLYKDFQLSGYRNEEI